MLAQIKMETNSNIDPSLHVAHLSMKSAQNTMGIRGTLE